MKRKTEHSIVMGYILSKGLQMDIEHKEFSKSVLIICNINEMLTELNDSIKKLHLTVYSAFTTMEALSIFKARMSSVLIIYLKAPENNAKVIKKIMDFLKLDNLKTNEAPQIITLKSALGSGLRIKVANLEGSEHAVSEIYSPQHLKSCVKRTFDRIGLPILD